MATSAAKKLNSKHKRFIEEYLKDFNGTKAAIRTGYSPKTAAVQASQLLRNPNVKEHLEKRDKEITEGLKLSSSRTLKEIIKLAFFDARKFYTDNGNLRDIQDLEDAEAAALAGVETIRRKNGEETDTIDKIKFSDRRGALELLSKIQGMHVDKLELTGKDGKDLEFTVSYKKMEIESSENQ